MQQVHESLSDVVKRLLPARVRRGELGVVAVQRAQPVLNAPACPVLGVGAVEEGLECGHRQWVERGRPGDPEGHEHDADDVGVVVAVGGMGHSRKWCPAGRPLHGAATQGSDGEE